MRTDRSTSKTKASVPIGVVHGRFQPLHLGHMKYILAAKSRCDFLFIGITNPDPYLTKKEITNPSRSMPSSNPFTYWERLLMIEAALTEAQMKREEFSVVPFPLNFPKRLKFYAPQKGRYYVTVYSQWERRKIEILQSIGLDVEVLWERSASDKGIDGSDVRRLMSSKGDWKCLVPPAVARIITQFALDKRVRGQGL